MNKKDGFVINLAEMTAGSSLLTTACGTEGWIFRMSPSRAPQYFRFIRQFFYFELESLHYLQITMFLFLNKNPVVAKSMTTFYSVKNRL